MSLTDLYPIFPVGDVLLFVGSEFLLSRLGVYVRQFHVHLILKLVELVPSVYVTCKTIIWIHSNAIKKVNCFYNECNKLLMDFCNDDVAESNLPTNINVIQRNNT